MFRLSSGETAPQAVLSWRWRGSGPSALPGCVPPVASLGHLIALKVLSEGEGEGRLEHQVDLRALFAVAGPGDLALARDAVAAIVSSGRNEGRDLQQDLERHVQRRAERGSLEPVV